MPRNKDYQPVDIETSRIRSLFHLPIEEAAKNCGICTTLLKRMCRRKGITRWPYRKMKSISRMIRTLEQCGEDNLDPKSKARLLQLREERDLIRSGRHEAVTGGFPPKRPKRQPSDIKSDDSSNSISKLLHHPAPLSSQRTALGPHGGTHHQPVPISYPAQFGHVNGYHHIGGQLPCTSSIGSTQYTTFVGGPYQLGYTLAGPLNQAYISPRNITSTPVWHVSNPHMHTAPPPPSQTTCQLAALQQPTLKLSPTGRKDSLQDVLDGALNLASLSNSPPRSSEPENGILPPLRSILNGIRSPN